jgi:hypothetical protein
MTRRQLYLFAPRTDGVLFLKAGMKWKDDQNPPDIVVLMFDEKPNTDVEVFQCGGEIFHSES